MDRYIHEGKKKEGRKMDGRQVDSLCGIKVLFVIIRFSTSFFLVFWSDVSFIGFAVSLMILNWSGRPRFNSAA